MKLLVFILSLLMFNSFTYAHHQCDANSASLQNGKKNPTDDNESNHKHGGGEYAKCTNNLASKDGKSCEDKVKRASHCCSSKHFLQCLTDQNDEDGLGNQAVDIVSGLSGGMGAAGLVIAPSLFKNNKGVCSFLEIASKAYVAVNTLAIGYCGKLIMDAKSVCEEKHQENLPPNPEDPELKQHLSIITYNCSMAHPSDTEKETKCINDAYNQKAYDKMFDEQKKELAWYVAKIGSGIYSAYQSNQCQKKIEAEKMQQRAHMLKKQTKPVHCTSGLMVAYDTQCSDYCAAINHQDLICQNVPRVPSAALQSNAQRQAAFRRTPFFSSNRFSKVDKKGLNQSSQKQKTAFVKKNFKENKKYAKSVFRKISQTVNKRLRKNNKQSKTSLSNQKRYFSKKKNHHSYTNKKKTSFLTKKDIFKTVSSAYDKICKNNTCYGYIRE